MARPTPHLADARREHGEGTGTAAIMRLLERGLDAVEAEHNQGQSHGPRLSLLGQPCARQTAFRMSGVPETNPPSVGGRLRMRFGHALEAEIIKILRAAGAEVFTQDEIRIAVGDAVVTGHPDALVYLPPELAKEVWLPTACLFEIKSTNRKAIYWMLKKGEQGRAAHRSQLGGYLHATQLGALPGPPIDLGWLVYLATEGAAGEDPVESWTVPYDRAKTEQELAGLVAVGQMVQRDEVPEIPAGFAADAYPCLKSYCGFYDRCWGEGE